MGGRRGRDASPGTERADMTKKLKDSSVELARHHEKTCGVLMEICHNAAFLIDQMEPGQRTTVTKLAEDAAALLSPPIPGEKALPIVRLFVDKCPGIVVLRGSTGGLYKGFRPAKSIESDT